MGSQNTNLAVTAPCNGVLVSGSKVTSIRAMPWTKNSKPVDEMIKALENCLTEPDELWFKTTSSNDKPNNRVVYTIHIFADFYLDINVINQKSHLTK